MKKTILFAAFAMIATTSSFAAESEISIIDRSDTMALVQVDGAVAKMFYNLIKYGKTGVVITGPARAALRDEVIGKNMSCSKAGSAYSCRIIASNGGKLYPETSVQLNER